MLRTIIGSDVADGRLRCRPELPEGVEKLQLRGIDLRGRKLSVP